MYGKSPSDVTTSMSEYASSLRKRLEEDYSRVRTQMSHKLDRQKDIYDEKVHGVPFKQNDLVMITFYCCTSRLREETTSFLDWTFQSG